MWQEGILKQLMFLTVGVCENIGNVNAMPDRKLNVMRVGYGVSDSHEIGLTGRSGHFEDLE